MADFIMPETQQHAIVIILIIYSVYLLKKFVELKEYISGRIAICSSFYVSYTVFFLLGSVELDRAFFYVPRPLIDRAPGNDVTSLTTYTTHTRVGDTRIYIYIYSSNPWESNHRDGPMGHNNNINKSTYLLRVIIVESIIIYYCE